MSPPDQPGGDPGQHTASRSRPEGCDKAAPSPGAPPVPGDVPALPARPPNRSASRTWEPPDPALLRRVKAALDRLA